MATKLFVGGLLQATTSQSLREHFEMCGEIEECYVLKDPVSFRSRGFGYVRFETLESAQKAMREVLKVDGKAVDVQLPKKDIPESKHSNYNPSKIFVGGIPTEVNEEELAEYFSQFGEVTSANILYERLKNRHRGFGYVLFADEEAVDRCLAMYFGHKLGGKWIEIKRCVPRDKINASHGIVRTQASRASAYREYDNNNYDFSMSEARAHHHHHRRENRHHRAAAARYEAVDGGYEEYMENIYGNNMWEGNMMVPSQRGYDSPYDYESSEMGEENWSHFGTPRRAYGGYRNVSETEHRGAPAPVNHADACYQRFLHEASSSSYHGFLLDEISKFGHNSELLVPDAPPMDDGDHYMGFFDDEYNHAPQNMGLFDNHAHPHYGMDYGHRNTRQHHHVTTNHERRFPVDHHQHQLTPYHPHHVTNQQYAPTPRHEQPARRNRHTAIRHTEKRWSEGMAMCPEGNAYNSKHGNKMGAPHLAHQHDYNNNNNNITTEYHQDWLPTRAPGGTAGRLSSGSLEIPCYDARYQYDGLDKFNHGTIKFDHANTTTTEEEEEHKYNFNKHHGARGWGHEKKHEAQKHEAQAQAQAHGPPRWSSSSSMMGSLSPTLSTSAAETQTVGSTAAEGGSPLNETTHTQCCAVTSSTPKSSLAPSEKEVVMKYMNMDSKAGVQVQVQDKFDNDDGELNFVVPTTTKKGRRLVKPPPGLGFDDEE